MNYDTAKAIATEIAPQLIVDPPHPELTELFSVRRHAMGAPFSIHLMTADPAAFQPIAAQDATPEIPAVPATEDHPGTPAIPARPAVIARTVEGQVAEAERMHLVHSLNEGLRLLPDPAANLVA